jgi:hypothetical protein
LKHRPLCSSSSEARRRKTEASAFKKPASDRGLFWVLRRLPGKCGKANRPATERGRPAHVDREERGRVALAPVRQAGRGIIMFHTQCSTGQTLRPTTPQPLITKHCIVPRTMFHKSISIQISRNTADMNLENRKGESTDHPISTDIRA